MSDFLDDFLRNWVEDSTVSQGLYELSRGRQLNPDTARDVVNRLHQDEGPRLIRKYIGDDNYNRYYPTNRKGPAWHEHQPTGVVDHYTAGVSVRGPLLWFSSRPRAGGIGNSSAHVVVTPEGETIFIINPLESVAWHARGANYLSIGIEHVNAGLLRENDNGELFYQVNRPYVVREAQAPIVMFGDPWEPYMRAQVLSNILLKRLFLCAIPTLLPERFVDHQMVEPDRKHDCGPLWPLPTLNEISYRWWDLRNFDALLPESGVLDVAGLYALSSKSTDLRCHELVSTPLLKS